MKLHIDTINDLVERQLLVWPEAKQRFDALINIKRKNIALDAFPVVAQLNPARIRSTAAKVDAASISERKCFLCGENRPQEQFSAPWPDQGWELLVNPFPILPIHFTIAAKKHTPQDEIPLEMAAMAELAPELAIFLNGARAGASAPDHLHCQGVLKSELPLVRLVEKYHSTEHGGWMSSEEFGCTLPFHFLSAVITPDMQGMLALSKVATAFGIDATTGEHDKGLVNAFFWISDNGLLRVVIIPRRAHRPRAYFVEGESHFTVSPGALDMAGLLILPIEDDFNRIAESSIRDIYADTAFAEALPQAIRKTFLED